MTGLNGVQADLLHRLPRCTWDLLRRPKNRTKLETDNVARLVMPAEGEGEDYKNLLSHTRVRVGQRSICELTAVLSLNSV